MMLLIFLAPGYNSLLSVIQIKQLHFTPHQMGVLTSDGAACAVAGTIAYGLACRRFDLRPFLAVGIILNVVSTLLVFFYNSFHAALIIVTVDSFMGTLAVLPVYDLAARATPRGCEAMGFSLMMAVRNVALFGSNLAGAWAAEKYHVSFHTMLVINAAFTACVLFLVPYIPAALVARRDGMPQEETSSLA